MIQSGATPKDGISGFPIYSNESKYQEKGRRMIKGVNPAAVTIIDGLQPFEPRHVSDPLYILNEMWNRDKHRLLNFTNIALYAYKATYTYPRKYRESPIRNLIGMNDGAELCRFRHPSDLTPEVRISHHYAHSGLVFKDAGPATGKEVVELLPQLVNVVESIANDLIATAV